MPPPTDAELLDEVAIRRLHARYGDVVTQRAWPALHELFVPGCPVELDLGEGRRVDTVAPGGIASFIGDAVERFSFFEFVILNATVAVDGDRASGRLYMAELRQDAASQRWSTAFGLYRDDFDRSEVGWRYAHRRYSSLARTTADALTPSMLTFPVPGP